MNDHSFYMIAKTMNGLEKMSVNELKDLGAQNVKIQKRQLVLRVILALCIKQILI